MRVAFRPSRLATAGVMRFHSAAFSGVTMGPPDPILGLGVAFAADTAPHKVNLGVGVYRDDNGKPFVLECVKTAEKRLAGTKDHEYAPINGVPSFVVNSQKLAFGDDSPALAAKRIATSQSLSGTGALRIAGDFLDRWYTTSKKIYLPNPTWGNHVNIFKDAGLTVERYQYFNPANNGLHFDAFRKDLEAAPKGSIVLLHACAHNPTGVDPTKEQWKEIVELVKHKEFLPLVDMAYQGFASGDPVRDAYGLRLMAQSLPSLVLCQSFAKSFGIYGERCGAVHFLCNDAGEQDRVLSQLKILIRPMYSNPPLYGARVVDTVLEDPALRAQWMTELQAMATRMNGIRGRLVEELKKAGSVRDWTHITNQIGMMAFTGLNKEQVARLKTEFNIYMTDDGRAAITGLNTKNVEYVAKAFHAVSK